MKTVSTDHSLMSNDHVVFGRQNISTVVYNAELVEELGDFPVGTRFNSVFINGNDNEIECYQGGFYPVLVLTDRRSVKDKLKTRHEYADVLKFDFQSFLTSKKSPFRVV